MFSLFRIVKAPLLAAFALFAGCVQEPDPAARVPATESVPPLGEASGPSVCATTGEDLALVHVNGARALTGQPAFRCLAKLSAMARAHAGFLARNEGLGLDSAHREQSGAPGYTGNTLKERAKAQGLDARDFWLAEGAGGGSGAVVVVEAHLATVYHRSALLAPGGRYFSFAEEKGVYPHAVMNMLLAAREGGGEPARWPAADQTGVAPGFNPSGEKPAPRASATSAGFPVSVHFPRSIDQKGDEPMLVIDEFRLTDAAGVDVPVALLSASTDTEIYPSDAFLLPEARLSPHATYVVRARMSYGELSLDDEWRFTTAE